LKSERLAAIGEVAAMVGHDLRNPLTGITGATYYLRTRLDSKIDAKETEMFDLIDKDIEYSNKIVNDLLDYSKEIVLELRPTTPREILKEALRMVEFSPNIKLVNQTGNQPHMKIDVEKTKRVFVNLLKNAVDAMPRGGTLTITSSKVADCVEFAFSDTGVGMSKDVLKKLWSPLFTTKARGMGFGLPICRRIVEAHGGNISAKSAVGSGTTFKVAIRIEPRIKAAGEKIWVGLPEPIQSTMKKT